MQQLYDERAEPFPDLADASAPRARLTLPVLRADERERLAQAYARTGDPRLREALILSHQGLVKFIAARFSGNGELLDDLIQVGNIGLINAVDRYRSDQRTRFATYATPTILGEIKRHFRDKTAGIKVPRPLQELYRAARRASVLLTAELGRAPSASELADRLGVTEEAVGAALAGSEAATHLVSLESGAGSSDGSASSSANLADVIGCDDKALRALVLQSDLRHALDVLETREHEVIRLRFFDELSQSKIAQRLKVSQMQVSRLQHRALARLRDMLAGNLRELFAEDRRAWGHRDLP